MAGAGQPWYMPVLWPVAHVSNAIHATTTDVEYLSKIGKKFQEIMQAGCMYSRVANVVWDSNTLLTHERYMKMKNWYINTFLIKTTSNYFWASEVWKNQSFQIKVVDSPINELTSN